ncbi:MAG: IS1595 family transposase [Bacteroidales bacterium]|nr:IS1595 family transposase [Bacteroidales bacterium]
METKVHILQLYATLNFSDKLIVLEEITQILEKEKSKSFEKKENTEANHTNVLTTNAQLSLAANTKEYPTISTSEKLIASESSLPGQLLKKPEKCIDCNSSELICWGFYLGERRYKCKSCGRTFTKNTLNVSHGIKKKDEFLDFGETMFNGQYHSLPFMSAKFKITTKTAFDWRHKYLSSISSTSEELKFKGKVEMDDVWVQFSEKGRKGTEDSRKRGGGTPGDNDNQVKVLFSVERNGATNFTVVRSGRLCGDDITRAIGSSSFEKGGVLISDKHPSISAFAKQMQIEHKTFKADKHVENKDIHVQTVNNMASRFKATINGQMRGVATKYLQNYANWFRIELQHKGAGNKIVYIIERYMENHKAWDYFSNVEKIYKRFIEKYTRLNYKNPVKREWKTCNWNYPRIEELLM